MHNPKRKRVLVIGCGPSGLVATKTLLSRGYTVKAIDGASAIGGAFRSKYYEDACLVSSKYITGDSPLSSSLA